MKRTSAVFVVSASVAALLLLVDSCSSASTGKVDVKNEFEKQGFTLIGHMSEDNITNSGLSSIGTKGISLYLSGENARETQMNAFSRCDRLFGRLLFILNDQQLVDVQLATHGIGEPFWTSAVFDENVSGSGYSYLGLDISVNPRHIRPERACSQAKNEMGLVVQGSMSNFGLCSARSDSSFRYICRV